MEFGSRLHPTVEPVAVNADAILEINLRRDLVLDGFLGSGRTMTAAGTAGEPAMDWTIVWRRQRSTNKSARHRYL